MKLSILIYIYIGIYVLFSVWTIIGDVKDKEPWWDVVSDVILLPLGGLGILLFLLDANEPIVKSAWKVVAILIVAGQLFTNIFTRHLTLTGKTELDPEKISQWVILGADLTLVVLLAPMFAMNLVFAFR